MDNEEFIQQNRKKPTATKNLCYYSNSMIKALPSGEEIRKNSILYEYVATKSIQSYSSPIFNVKVAQKQLTEEKIRCSSRLSLPIQKVTPKVQLVNETPGRIEVQRRRRWCYSGTNLVEIIESAGLKSWQLSEPLDELNIYQSECNLFPLEWFDCMQDTDSFEYWLNLGKVDGISCLIPAIAFLEAKNPQWTKVVVKDFDRLRQKWIISDMLDETFEISRIFLMFLAENPDYFCERLKRAIEFRALCQNHFKFNLLVDCMILTGVPLPTTEIMQKVEYLVGASPSDKLDKLLEQIKLEYKRTLGMLELKHHILLNPIQYDFIKVPKDEVRIVKPMFEKMENFNEIKQMVRVKTIFCLDEVIGATEKVLVECDKVANFLLFTSTFSKTASLEEFCWAQRQTTTNVLNYLKHEWIDTVSGLICLHLRSIGKGAFDLDISNWTIFKVSKIIRFLQFVKLHMETSLRQLILNSINLCNRLLCEPCKSFVTIDKNFKWNHEDLITSPFERPVGSVHVFYMTLQMNEEGAFYSTNPQDFSSNLLHLYDSAIRPTRLIPLIDSRVMHKLVFSSDLYYSSIDERSDKIYLETQALLERCYEKARIPLLAYAEQYNKQLEFFVMDVKQYVAEFRQQPLSAQEIQTEIEMHLRLKKNLEVTIPESIAIGPFLINVNPLKLYLIAKRQDLATKLLAHLTNKIKEETLAIHEKYAAVIRRLSDRPISIEDLFATKEWMATVPEIVNEYDQQMTAKLFDYEILYNFYQALPSENFQIKWQTIAAPQKCLQQIAITNELFEEDVARFLKQQIGDVAAFDRKVEELNVNVRKFSTKYDYKRATEVAIEIKNVWTVIVETSEFGMLLNRRQRLFDLPAIDMAGIDQLLESFLPYKTLWITGADFIKSEQLWCGNPLSTISADTMRQTVDEYKRLMSTCLALFNELEDVQKVAEYFLQKMQDFQPTIDCIGWIRNPAWLTLHWQELCQRTEMELKYSPSMNFNYCLAKGIMKWLNVVREISLAATENKDKLEATMRAEQERQRQVADELFAKKNRRRGRKLD